MALKRRAPIASAIGVRARLDPDLTAEAARPRLGDILVDRDWASRAAVEDAVVRAPTRRLGATLFADGLLDEATLARAVSEQSGLAVVDIRDHPAEPEATRMLSQHEAHSYDAFPFALEHDTLHVVIADPFDPEMLEVLQALPVSTVSLSLGLPSHVRSRVNQTYRALSDVNTHIAAFAVSDAAAELAAAVESIGTLDDDAPIIQVVNKILTQALRDRASDVHIEPTDVEV